MSDHARGELYEEAIHRFERHLHRADDGTFWLDVKDGHTIGVDPVVFADLRRSLEETNKKVRRGEIDPQKLGARVA